MYGAADENESLPERVFTRGMSSLPWSLSSRVVIRVLIKVGVACYTFVLCSVYSNNAIVDAVMILPALVDIVMPADILPITPNTF